MLNINQLNQEIKQQTRNGRKDLYLKVSDLEELGYETNTVAERIFVDENEILPLIKEYERKAFRESLKVEGVNHLTNNNIYQTDKSLDRER